MAINNNLERFFRIVFAVKDKKLIEVLISKRMGKNQYCGLYPVYAVSREEKV